MFYSYIHSHSDDSADNWRLRYKSLSLHGPVWANHLPYFPPNLRLLLQLFLYLLTKHTNSVATLWQTCQPIRDLRRRPRAEHLMLIYARPNRDRFRRNAHKWNVTINRGNGSKCMFAVGHVVLAAGLGVTPQNIEAF